MKKDKNKLTISMMDLDHILDTNEIDINRPPSDVFIEGLKIELEMNGFTKKDISEIDTVEIKLNNNKGNLK